MNAAVHAKRCTPQRAQRSRSSTGKKSFTRSAHRTRKKIRWWFIRYRPKPPAGSLAGRYAIKRRTFINCTGKTAFIAGLAVGGTVKTEKAGSAGPLVDTPEQRADTPHQDGRYGGAGAGGKDIAGNFRHTVEADTSGQRDLLASFYFIF